MIISLALFHIVKNISRRDSVVINKLQISHSHLAHLYLISNVDLRLCETCGLPLTVKHILVDCHSLEDIRENFLMVQSEYYWFCYRN